MLQGSCLIMARKLCVHFLVFVCLALTLSSDITSVELQQGKTGRVQNPRIANMTFDISDIHSAYWYKLEGPTDNEKLLISNFGGIISLGSKVPDGKYSITSTFSLEIHNVSHSDTGPYKWKLKPKFSALVEGVVNVTTIEPPEHMEDALLTPQPDTFKQNIVVIIIVIVVVVAVVAIGGGVCLYRRKSGNSCWKRTRNGDHVAIPMDDIDSVQDPLTHELKVLYKKEMKNAPIHPRDDSRTKSVEDIYIFPDMFKHQQGEPVKSLEDLKELLMKDSHVAVMGRAGCGKMALIRRIGYDWACENFTGFKYVVILQKKEIRGTTGVLEAIGKLLPSDTDINKKQLKQIIKHQKDKVLMIVDASCLLESSDDLISTAPKGDWSLKDLLSFNALRECSLLVTISSHQLDKLQNLYCRRAKYTVIETTGFSPDNIKQYINKLFEESEEGNRLIEKVETSEIIQTLAKSPIMLQALCVIWADDKNLPKELAKVYDRAVHVLADHISHDGSNGLDVNNIDAFQRSIGEIAFGGLDPKEEKSPYSPDDFPNEEHLQFGLSIGVMSQEIHFEADKQSCHVKFLHLYQEYFAACYLVRGKVEEKLLPLVTRETVQKMEMLIRFCCGMDGEAKSLITSHLKNLHGVPDDGWLQHLIHNPSGY